MDSIQNNTSKKLFFVACLFTSLVFSQKITTELILDVDVYKPKKSIIKIIENHIDSCFGNVYSRNLEIEHYVGFFQRNDSTFMDLISSKNVITNFSVELGILNIKGVFSIKGKLGFIDVDNMDVKIIKKYFRKTSKNRQVKIKTSEGNLFCGEFYFIENKKTSFLSRTNSVMGQNGAFEK